MAVPRKPYRKPTRKEGPLQYSAWGGKQHRPGFSQDLHLGIPVRRWPRPLCHLTALVKPMLPRRGGQQAPPGWGYGTESFFNRPAEKRGRREHGGPDITQRTIWGAIFVSAHIHAKHTHTQTPTHEQPSSAQAKGANLPGSLNAHPPFINCASLLGERNEATNDVSSVSGQNAGGKRRLPAYK